jgi:hypothetical protein
VLWVEDGAFVEFTNLCSPVYTSGKYDLEVAVSATEAIKLIKEGEFDAVVVDIRIIPGNDNKWISLYNQYQKNKRQARLGLHLLRSLLTPEKATVDVGGVPEWLGSSRFGVLTVETEAELRNDLNDLRVKVYQQKMASMNPKTLLHVFDKITEKRAN